MGHDEKDNAGRLADGMPCTGVLVIYQKVDFLSKLFHSDLKRGKPVPVRLISREGLCFLSREALKPGQQLRMVVSLGHGKPKLPLDAQVSWCGRGEGLYPHAVEARFINVTQKVWDVLTTLEVLVESQQDEGWREWRLRTRDRRNKIWGQDGKGTG